VNIFQRWGSYTAANALGMYATGGIHPSQTGANDILNAFINDLKPAAADYLNGEVISKAQTNYGFHQLYSGNYPLLIDGYQNPALEISDLTHGTQFVAKANNDGSFSLTGNNAVTVGSNSSGAQFVFNGNGTISEAGFTNSSTGDYVCLNAGVLGLNTSTCSLSDETAKQDIAPLTDALDEVMRFEPVHFRYKPGNGYDTAVEHVGFTAQRMAKVDPRVVEYKDGQPHAIAYENITAINSAAIQQQQREVMFLMIGMLLSLLVSGTAIYRPRKRR